jgi:hypothetical protein
MRALVEHFRARTLFRAPHHDGLATHDLCDLRVRVAHVADEQSLYRTHDDARRFEPHIETVRAEVAFLGRMVFRVDEDRIVGTGRHARLTSDADRLVEVDDAVRPHVHRLRGASCRAGRGLTLVAACHLKGPTRLRKHANVDRLHVGAGHRQGDFVLRLAGRRAGVAADASALVDDLGPEWAARVIHLAPTTAPVGKLLQEPSRFLGTAE